MNKYYQAFKPMVSDFIATIVFIAIYAITGSIYAATPIGIAAGIGQILWLKYRRREVSNMQWMSLVLVIVLGAATLLTHDARFVMIKPSIGTFAMGCIMMQRGWMLRYLPPIVVNNVPRALPIAYGYMWAAYLFLLTAANLYVAFAMGPKAWAWYNSVVPMTGQIALFAAQFIHMKRVMCPNIRAKLAAGLPKDAAMMPAE